MRGWILRGTTDGARLTSPPMSLAPPAGEPLRVETRFEKAEPFSVANMGASTVLCSGGVLGVADLRRPIGA